MPACNVKVTIDRIIVVPSHSEGRNAEDAGVALKLHIKEWDEFVSLGSWIADTIKEAEEMAHKYARKVGLE